MYIEVIHNSKSVPSETYRTLRSNIQFSNFGQKIKTIVVTSSNPNEGKSTVSVNLAVSLAQQGKKVLLIDADLRKPTQNRLLSLENFYGLSTFLLGESTVDAIDHLDIEGVRLDVLTSGPVPPSPAEMLGSQTMFESLAAFKEHYDYVIIDTPPILAVTDSQILSRLADATLLVVDANKTKRRQVIEAKRRLDNVGAHLLGTVMNKVADYSDDYYYYY